VLSEENKEFCVIFSKTAMFLSFYERNQTTIVTSLYSKSLWNELFADMYIFIHVSKSETPFISAEKSWE
jgi:hypothetical protein